MLNDHRPVELDSGQPAADAPGVAAIFARLPARTYESEVHGGYFLVDRAARAEAGRAVFSLLKADPGADAAFIQTARGWLAARAAVEAHEFKLPAALFEDYAAVSAEWRPRLLAASAHWLHGKQSPASPVLRQAREALQIEGEGPTCAP